MAAVQASLDSLRAESAAKHEQHEAAQMDVGARLALAEHAVESAQGLLTEGQKRMGELQQSLSEREAELRGLQGRLRSMEKCRADFEREAEQRLAGMDAGGLDALLKLGQAQAEQETRQALWAASRQTLEQQLAVKSRWLRDGEQHVDERCGEMAAAFARLEGELERLQAGLSEAQLRRARGDEESAELVSRLEQELAGARVLSEQQRGEAEQAGAEAAQRLAEEQQAGAARLAARSARRPPPPTPHPPDKYVQALSKKNDKYIQ